MIILVIFISSCSKVEEKNITVQQTNSNSSYTYYLDQVQVNEGTYDPVDSTLWVHTDYIHSTGNYIVNAFTSSQGYINYGNERGIPLEKHVQFETEINTQRLQGEITDEVAQNIYNRIFGTVGPRTSAVSPIIIGYDICGEQGGKTTIIFRVQPVYTTMKYEVSMVSAPTAIYKVITGWGKSYFRKRLGSFGFWGLQNVCLPKELDNKMASSIN